MKNLFMTFVLLLISTISFAQEIQISKVSGLGIDIVENSCALRETIEFQGTIMATPEGEMALALVAKIPYAGNKFFLLSSMDKIKSGTVLTGNLGDDKLSVESYDGRVLRGRFSFNDNLGSYTCDSKVDLKIF